MNPNTPPVGPHHPPPKLTVFQRMIRSRRVRVFFLIAIALHASAAILISANKTVHDWMFGKGEQTIEKREASASAIRFAIDTLLKLYTDHANQTLGELINIRGQLLSLTASKLQSLKIADQDRKDKIEKGIWPTAERPDKTAKYEPRVDIEPPRIALRDVPDILGRERTSEERERPEKVFIELYREHPKLEAEIGKIYERFHALELAEHPVDPIPVSQSLKNTKLTLPPRRDCNVLALHSDIRTVMDGRFDNFKKEIVECYLETQDMVNTAKRWLELAQMADKGLGMLSGMFGQQYNVVPPPTAYFGHYVNPRMLRRVSYERLIDPKIVLGNRIGDSELSMKADWMSVDRWWCIGPFHHPGSQRRLADLERKFPPENYVDLDATYEGKEGRKLKWKYRHIGEDFIEKGIRFEPFTADNESYAIWYFYTIVYSDRNQSVLTSFASDDYGVCYVNGRRVWQSPPDTQPWVPFTRHGFEAVPLRKGYNAVLFKLENAMGTTGFSVIMMTHEDKDLIEAATKDE
jgi:hypothetical protein